MYVRMYVCIDSRSYSKSFCGRIKCTYSECLSKTAGCDIIIIIINFYQLGSGGHIQKEAILKHLLMYIYGMLILTIQYT